MADLHLTDAECQTVASVVTGYNATYHTCAPGYWESVCNVLQAAKDLGIGNPNPHYWTEPPDYHEVGNPIFTLEALMNLAVFSLGHGGGLFDWINSENLRRIGQIVLTYPYVRSSQEFLAAASP